MLAYIILILIICIDFGAEFLLKKYNIISKPNEELKQWQKIIKYFFKFRILSICTFVFLSTFKSLNVGLDTYNYYLYYVRLGNGEISIYPFVFEPGFSLLNFILAKCHLPFQVLLFISSLFISISITIFIKKHSVNEFLSMLLYVALGTFAFSLCVLRQIIALAILLFAISMILDNKKWWNSVLLIILAALFHKSAIIGLVFVAIKYLKPTLKLIIPVTIGSIVFIFIFPYIMKFIESFTPLNYYSKYFIDNKMFIGDTSLLNILYNISLTIIFVALFVCRKNLLLLNENDAKIYDYFILAYLLVPIIRFAGMILNAQELFNRLVSYFMISLIILVPLFLKGLKHKKRLYITATVLVYVVAFSYMYYLYAIKLSCGVVPYIFYF